VRILVTGGAGFIGSHLVERLLADGKSVTVIDDLSTGTRANLEPFTKNPRLKLIASTISNCSELQALVDSSESIYHLAAAVGVRQPTSLHRLEPQRPVFGRVGQRTRQMESRIVGGKTGTSEKVVNGRYAKKRVLNSFTAIMPADDPKYQILVMIDEPQALPETHGFITSGWNAVPTGGNVISRIAPLLGVEPRFDLPPSDRLILATSKTTQ